MGDVKGHHLDRGRRCSGGGEAAVQVPMLIQCVRQDSGLINNIIDLCGTRFAMCLDKLLWNKSI